MPNKGTDRFTKTHLHTHACACMRVCVTNKLDNKLLKRALYPKAAKICPFGYKPKGSNVGAHLNA